MLEKIKEFLQHPALDHVVLGASLSQWVVGLAIGAVIALGLMFFVRIVCCIILNNSRVSSPKN